MKLIVDGYNLIRRSPKYARLDIRSLQLGRDALLADLTRYRTYRDIEIVVVFDGKGARSPVETIEHRDGIQIIYSRYDMTADDAIIDLAERHGRGAIVVSSDRRVAQESERFGAQTIDSNSFEEKMVEVISSGGMPDDAVPSEFDADDDDQPGKKGNPFRPSKKEKAKKQALRKI